MHTISLDRTKPKAFVLVPYGNFSESKPILDQVWTLDLSSAESYPFCLTTTSGLRAKCMRLFFNLIHNNKRISKPEDFSRPPRVVEYSPASLQVEAEYQEKISFLFTFFFLEPEILTGNIQITNFAESPNDIILQLAFNLVPMEKGQPSHPERIGNNQFVTGKTAQLEPVLFMTGGPSAISSPYPALSIQLDLQPKKAQKLSWVLASKETKSLSFGIAKKIITSGWQDIFRAHAMDHASRTFSIKTGNPDWDAAFFLSQVNANTHWVKYETEPEKAVFVKIRLPDYSSFSNNFIPKTNDLTNFELNHLFQVILPAEVETAAHLLEKQIHSQVDQLQKKGQKKNSFSRFADKSCPILASLLLEIFEITRDTDLLKRCLPKLDFLFKSWGTKDHLNKEKVFIHWDKPSQLEIETGLFTFDIWHPYNKGLNIKKVESPALYAMLLKEAKALSKISKILNDHSRLQFYADWENQFQQRLNNCWDDDINLYRYQDIETHLCSSGKLFYQGNVFKKVEIKQVFKHPQRLQCHIFASDEHTRNCIIKFTGRSSSGDYIEEIFKSPGILWVSGRAHLTTENLYAELDAISFEGLNPKDDFILEPADYTQTDISCLLPIWAGSGAEIRRQALISNLLDPTRPVFSHGIPETGGVQQPLPKDLPIRVNVMWNTLILEGITSQGDSPKAAGLFANIMNVITQGLIDYDGFFPLYDANTAQPVGQYNAINGLVPIQLFLKIAGIKLFSPSRVALWGSNPFPWPIEIHWRGLSLVKDNIQTKITFPNGATAENVTQESILITSE